MYLVGFKLPTYAHFALRDTASRFLPGLELESVIGKLVLRGHEAFQMDKLKDNPTIRNLFNDFMDTDEHQRCMQSPECEAAFQK